MRRAGIRVHAIVEPSAPRDSASQVSRATLGLREMLLRGALRPGQRIAEIPLSAKLGVSRTPLRLLSRNWSTKAWSERFPIPDSPPASLPFPRSGTRSRPGAFWRGPLPGSPPNVWSIPAQLDPVRKINRTMEEIPSLDVEGFTQYLSLNEVYHLAIFDLAKKSGLAARG